jgi:hypothetical protein
VPGERGRERDEADCDTDQDVQENVLINLKVDKMKHKN